MALPPKKAKLVCTIGPASESPEFLRRMLQAAMNIARLNFSHGDFTCHTMAVAQKQLISTPNLVGKPVITASQLLESMVDQVAIASAKMAYHIYKEVFGSDRFRKLAAQGARSQRLLWASTSTKNSDYSDVKYVEALIGPDTVNTAPLETLDAYRDHGEPKARLDEDVKEARWVLERLPELGIGIDKVTRQLEDDGVEKFNQPFDKLMKILAQRSAPQTKAIQA